MTAVQAIIEAAIYAFSSILPVGHSAHTWAMPYLVGWSTPSVSFQAALYLSMGFALLVLFRHDWASMISSLLGVILLWRKPMTLDERMPFFIILSSIPLSLGWFFFGRELAQREVGVYWISLALVLPIFPLILGDRMNRGTKNMLGWNWVDSIIVGFGQLLTFVPGAGRQIGFLAVGLLRNYQREAVFKYSLFTLAPILIAQGLALGSAAHWEFQPTASGTSWLSLGLGVFVAFFVALGTGAGFLKQITYRGFSNLMMYRILLAVALLGMHFYRGDA